VLEELQKASQQRALERGFEIQRMFSSRCCSLLAAERHMRSVVPQRQLERAVGETMCSRAAETARSRSSRWASTGGLGFEAAANHLVCVIDRHELALKPSEYAVL
jgi:hypothetical protein